MNNRKWSLKTAVLLVVALVWGVYMPVLATGLSNDNSLASLGILTEGAEVSPEFGYGTTEYNVTVPAGTQSLELDPVPSNENAWIVDISGTELVDGEATVVITVSAESGEQYPYYLYVSATGEAAGTTEQTEAQTQPQPETEPETEDPRYVKVDRTALEEAEKTIEVLKTETSSYRDRAGVLMKILYGMIAFCVVLLFVVINLILKRRDLKAELNEYRGYGYSPQEDGYAGDAGYDGGQSYAGGAGYDDGQGYAGGAGYGSGQGYDDGSYDGEYYEGDIHPAFYEEEKPAARQVKQPKQKTARKDAEQKKAERKAPKQKEPETLQDDPSTVPKPSKAKKKPKKMPEYQQEPEGYTYQAPAGRKDKDKNVEVTMIDL